LDERVEQLASEVAALREELAEVSASLGALRRSLGEGE
jgi:prefoldin subunit 5